MAFVAHFPVRTPFQRPSSLRLQREGRQPCAGLGARSRSVGVITPAKGGNATLGPAEAARSPAKA